MRREANSISSFATCPVPERARGGESRRPSGRSPPAGLAGLCGLQDLILEKAGRFVAPGGVLAYATCSLLNIENEDRIRAFLKRRGDWRRIGSARFTPLDGGDGFPLALLGRNGERPGTEPGR